MNGNGLTVRVEVGRLKTALGDNLTKHTQQYQKAKAGYIKVTTEQLKAYVQQLADGEMLVHRFINAPPEDHSEDYIDALAMMDWATNSTIELTQQQFKQYVQDDWGWKQAWVTSNTAYLQA